MSEALYLIAHKVRGEPAFDIAAQIEVEGEVWWIIPTSGHRAYPYWHVELDRLKTYFYSQDGQWTDRFDLDLPEMPADLDDHYPLRASAEAPKPSASGLLAALGLGKPKVTITRRV